MVFCSDANVVRAGAKDALGSLERMLVGALGPAALMEWRHNVVLEFQKNGGHGPAPPCIVFLVCQQRLAWIFYVSDSDTWLVCLQMYVDSSA